VRPGFSPLDDELELLPGHLTPSLAEQLVRLGAWLPFEPAARMLGYFSKVTVSAATARRRAEQAGAAYEAVRTAEVARLERELPLAPTGPALQQLSVDGAMVPLTGKRWGEVKLLAIGTVEAPVWGDDEWRVHASAVSYFGRMTDAETFGRLATVETHRRGTERAGRVCAGVDGAEWQQGFIDLHRPDAVRILDFPHAGEYVARAGQAVFGAGTDAMTEWLAEHLHALKHGAEATVLRVLAELRQRVAREGTPEALAVVATSLTYLEKRREQLRYAEFQAHGYPIGSGMLESGNKLVTEARLKGAGMHGAPAHVNPMIALRTLVCADRWDEGWALISTRLRAEALARTPTRRVEPPPQPPAALDSSVTPLAPTLPAGAAAQPPPVVAVGPTSPRVLTPTAAPEQRARPAAPAPPPTSRRPSTHHPWRRPLIPPDRRQPLAS
jgi:hypothetical protein